MLAGKQPGARTLARCGCPALLLILVLAVGRRRNAPISVVLKSILRQLRRIPRTLPSWPPPPGVLLRQGSVVIVLAGACLALGGFCSGASADQDEEGHAWVTHERKKRLTVLSDLLTQIPLERLCEAVPGLRSLLSQERAKAVKVASPGSEGSVCTSGEEPEFPVTADAVADASEKLAKVHRDSEVAWEGYAVAAALTASELRRATLAARGADPEPRAPGEGVLHPGASANVDALRMRITAAEEFESQVSVQCPHWRLARCIAALYRAPLSEASVVLRTHRAAQWRRILQLLWRFQSTLPYLVLSWMLSGVLGAFSAMRLHYQAAVINLAKESVTRSSGVGVAASLASQVPVAASVGETVGAMIVSEVISQLADFARARFTLRGKSRVVQELKVALFEALLRQDLEYLEQCDLWQLRSMIGSCGTTVGQVVDFPATAVEAFVRMFAAVLVLWRQSPQMAVFLGAALPSRLLLGRLVDVVGDRLEQRCCLPDFRGQINACWSALVRPASLRTMRAFAREPVEVASFARFLAAQDRLQEQGALIYRLQQPFRAFLEHGVEIAALWYGGRLAVRGELEFGDLSSVVLVAQGAFDGARFAYAAAAGVSAHAVGPLSQMASLLTQQPRIGLDHPPYESMPDPGQVQWRIRFDDVSFAYPQRPGALVLNRLSFEAQAGEFLGVLGSTGAGKTTVFGLILRLYEPTSGRILLDERDIRSYNPLWLRRHVGMVSQELVLCHRTIRENLVYGCSGGSGRALVLPDLPDDEAKAALRLAQCEDAFFNAAAFPSLWHTDVGEGGSDLSGGEKQRLAIARAVAKRPRLLLLDEATSALDELSQARLQEALEELRRREALTVVCIAHRLSNLSKADRLVVLADGQAAEEGTPAELLAAPGGRFAEYAKAHHESVPSAAPPAEAGAAD